MSYGEYNAMIETGNECQLSSLLVVAQSRCYCGRLHGSVVPAKFLLESLNNVTCENMRLTTRWLWYGLGEQSTLRIREPDTARTKRALLRLTDTSSLDSRLYQAKRQLHTIHAWIVPSCVVSARTVFVVLGHTPRAFLL